MFSQSFMTACIRTAGLRLQSTDKAVGYDPWHAIYERSKDSGWTRADV
jgi:hypothetical protein